MSYFAYFITSFYIYCLLSAALDYAAKRSELSLQVPAIEYATSWAACAMVNLRHNQAALNHPLLMTKPLQTNPAVRARPALRHPTSMQDARLRAEAQLRATRVRVTSARVQVLAELLSAPSAVSHQDIQDQLSTLDRVTLYRALDCLAEAGLAHKIASDDRVFRYSAGAEHALDQNALAQDQMRHPHGHFKCTRCGRMFCVEPQTAGDEVQADWQQQLRATLLQTLGAGFQSHDIELTIKGWCADCASISN